VDLPERRRGPWPVFDLERGLGHLGGRRALLADTLARFCVEHAATTSLCALASRDPARRSEAFHEVHTLKGTAGLLGLSALEAEAAAAQAALGDPTAVWPDDAALIAAHKAAIAAIQAAVAALRGG